MQIVTDAIEAAADEHIYFSKEASSGGQGFGGGGCGALELKKPEKHGRQLRAGRHTRAAVSHRIA